MKRDFTLRIYEDLLDAFIEAGYSFQTFRDYLKAPEEKVVILRHDVDKRPGNALMTAEIEHAKGLKASYYFRDGTGISASGQASKNQGIGA